MKYRSARTVARNCGGWIWLVGTLICGGAIDCGGPIVSAAEDTVSATFTKSQRHCIDDNALWGPAEKQNVTTVEASASAVQWLIARTPLPIAEEIERAAKIHADVLANHETSDGPPPVADILSNLVDAIPPRMRSADYQFTVTIVDQNEQNSFSAGGGHIYLSDLFLQSSPADDPVGRDRIAFVLAHELGHLCLGHAKRLFQREWLRDELKRDIEADSERKGNGEQIVGFVRGVGAVLEASYSREDDFHADLFAIHLCRNAGFDVENGLDVLRRGAVAQNTSLLLDPPERLGVPPVEPEIQAATTGESFTLASRPTFSHRLRRVRLELDGLIYGDEYGLFEFDRESLELQFAEANSIRPGERVVVCIHGMESSLGVYKRLMEHLAESDADAKIRIFGFQYPADESLARSAKYLAREMRRVGAESAEVDFVCHSAGGLVLRHYVEVDGGDAHRVYFQGTPHLGSNLAALRSLLEVGQFMGDLNLGYDAALASAIRDGHGQISYDLLPNSLFLTFLNRPSRQRHLERYTIYRGQAFSLTRSLVIKAAWSTTLKTLARRLDAKGKDDVNAKFARAALDALILPDEIIAGDLCVTPGSAGLDGVNQIYDYRLNHNALPRDPDVVDHLVRQLISDNQ
ncbi:MAG: M48 family metalloprotease [Planctomycetales bacterium]|nr:M48 family metalloprotease [Planctomycetales bacterium]